MNEFQTAEQEKALREQERNLGESSGAGGASKPIDGELDNVAATNGRYLSCLTKQASEKSYLPQL